jgi:hypothetical protein
VVISARRIGYRGTDIPGTSRLHHGIHVERAHPAVWRAAATARQGEKQEQEQEHKQEQEQVKEGGCYYSVHRHPTLCAIHGGNLAQRRLPALCQSTEPDGELRERVHGRRGEAVGVGYIVVNPRLSCTRLHACIHSPILPSLPARPESSEL